MISTAVMLETLIARYILSADPHAELDRAIAHFTLKQLVALAPAVDRMLERITASRARPS